MRKFRMVVSGTAVVAFEVHAATEEEAKDLVMRVTTKHPEQWTDYMEYAVIEIKELDYE